MTKPQHTFATQYAAGTVVLENGQEIPLSEIFDRNPDLYEAGGDLRFRCPQHPEVKSYAHAYFLWDGERHNIELLTLGASGAFLARRSAK